MSTEERKDSAADDGMSPAEDEGAECCQADADRCEHSNAVGDPPEECSFDLMEELHDAFPVEPIPVIMGKDGLPEIVTDPVDHAFAVPFTHETTVCIEDERTYEEIFADDSWPEKGWLIVDRDKMSPAAVGYRDTGAPMVRYHQSRFNRNGSPRSRRSVPAEQVKHGWGVSWAEIDGELWAVRPIRARCKHYCRQVLSNDDVPDPNEFGHQVIFRSCMVRRSNGGAFMKLGDQGIYACDLRDPPDRCSSEEMDRKDQDRLKAKAHEIMVPAFGIGSCTDKAR